MTSLISLGSVWLDEIRISSSSPIPNIPGGSVTFGTLGARLFASHNPQSITLIFNAGRDFPSTTTDTFRSWGIDLHERRCDAPAARGIVFYERGDGNRKGFQRLTPPLPIAFQDLSPEQKTQTRAFHIFGTADDIETQFHSFPSSSPSSHDKQDNAAAQNTTTNESTPMKPSPPSPSIIIWEPHAKTCTPALLPDHLKAAARVNVFSPNHEELASFFTKLDDPDRHSSGAEADQQDEKFDPAIIEQQAAIFYHAMNSNPSSHAKGQGCVIVRAAGYGCFIMAANTTDSTTNTDNSTTTSPPTTLWLPPYHAPSSPHVIDPTGAGNSFLGALAIGYQETGSYIEAAKYGMVAASLVIEQVGLPMLDSGAGKEEGEERWNGSLVRERLEGYRLRVGGVGGTV